LEPVRKIADPEFEEDFMVFEPEKVRYSKGWGKKRYPYIKADHPEIKIMYFIKDKNDEITFEVFQDESNYYKQKFLAEVYGFNVFKWDLKVHPLKDNGKLNTRELTFIDIGKYTLRFTFRDQVQEVTLEIQ
jgi:hypothetical protein